jgi:hypothetical protein
MKSKHVRISDAGMDYLKSGAHLPKGDESSAQSGGEEIQAIERGIKLRDEYFTRAADLYVQDHNPDSYEGSNIEKAFIAGAKCFAASPFSTHPPVVEGGLRPVKASKRLPEESIDDIYIRIGGNEKQVARFYDGKFHLYVERLDRWQHIVSDTSSVEWFEPIPTQVTEDK